MACCWGSAIGFGTGFGSGFGSGFGTGSGSGADAGGAFVVFSGTAAFGDGVSGFLEAVVVPEVCPLPAGLAGFSLFAGAAASAAAFVAGSALVSLAVAEEAESDEAAAIALALGFGPFVGLVALAPEGFMGVLGAAADGFALVAAGALACASSFGLVVEPFALGFGSTGDSALRLEEVPVFFVVVGFFAIAAHLRDQIFECRAWSAPVRDMPGTCQLLNRLLLQAPRLVPLPLSAAV